MNTENWVPLLDYAVLKGISTSTIRRYIKSSKLKFKVVKGRYLILDEIPNQNALAQKYPQYSEMKWDQNNANANGISVYQRVRELEEKLGKSQEQITELKMLVALYEEKLGPLNKA